MQYGIAFALASGWCEEWFGHALLNMRMQYWEAELRWLAS
jgi:hypothetical protein